MGETNTSQLRSDDIKDIISATIKELNASDAQVQFKKPTTIQGWVYAVLGFCSVLGILFTAVVFLNNVATHSKIPYHSGTEELVSTLHADHMSHATSEELHHREEQLELKMVEQVTPIKENLRTIQLNQANIQTQQANFTEDFRDIRNNLREVQRGINKIADKIE